MKPPCSAGWIITVLLSMPKLILSVSKLMLSVSKLMLSVSKLMLSVSKYTRMIIQRNESKKPVVREKEVPVCSGAGYPAFDKTDYDD